MNTHLAIIAAVTFGGFVLLFGSSALRFTIGCFAILAGIYALGVAMLALS